jgi:hypothetical protein
VTEPAATPRVVREWVTITDPNDEHLEYTFDVSFLLSGYRCIYGAGCQGIAAEGPNPALGCCEHGAYLNEDDDRHELQRVVVEELDETIMQFHPKAVRKGCVERDEDKEWHTRRVDGACIFLNRDGFPGGAGCALHRLAAERGEHHMTYKPVVCWQLPLHRTVTERVGNDGETVNTHTIAAFERGQWGEGGADFHWYCTEDPAAFIGATPVYMDMEYELRDMVGNAVYDALAAHLDQRRKQRGVVRFLPLVS